MLETKCTSTVERQSVCRVHCLGGDHLGNIANKNIMLLEGNIYLSTFQQQQNITFSNIYIYIYALYICIYMHYIYALYIYIYIYIYNMTKIYPCDKTLGMMSNIGS